MIEYLQQPASFSPISRQWRIDMKFYPFGRLGITLSQMSLEGLDMLVRHCPDGDAWLEGESLDAIIKRMALLSGRTYEDIKCEVALILKEKHEKEVMAAAAMAEQQIAEFA